MGYCEGMSRRKLQSAQYWPKITHGKITTLQNTAHGKPGSSAAQTKGQVND